MQHRHIYRQFPKCVSLTTHCVIGCMLSMCALFVQSLMNIYLEFFFFFYMHLWIKQEMLYADELL